MDYIWADGCGYQVNGFFLASMLMCFLTILSTLFSNIAFMYGETLFKVFRPGSTLYANELTAQFIIFKVLVLGCVESIKFDKIIFMS